MRVSQGLAFGEKFSKREYGRVGGAGFGARCYVETPVAAGGPYDLDGFSAEVGWASEATGPPPSSSTTASKAPATAPPP